MKQHPVIIFSPETQDSLVAFYDTILYIKDFAVL